MPPASKVKAPQLSITQPDTTSIANELDDVRNLEFPIAVTSRIQALGKLRGYAASWDVKWVKFEISDYQQSVEKFEKIKGEVSKKIRIELQRLAERDAATLKTILGSSMMDFGQGSSGLPKE